MRTAAIDAGADPGVHPQALAAIGNMERQAGKNPISLANLDVKRQVFGDVRKTPNEARVAGAAQDVLANFMENIQPNQLLYAGGNPAEAMAALNEAKPLWAKMRKTQVIEGLMSRAQNKASNYSQSGVENAIRSEFRSLAQTWQPSASRSPQRAQMAARQWTADERAAIEKVAQGGKLDNVTRFIGKFAPRGPVSAGMVSMLGATLGGPAGAALAGAAGTAGRGLATSRTVRRADLAAQLISGIEKGKRPSATRAALTRALLANQGAQQAQ